MMEDSAENLRKDLNAAIQQSEVRNDVRLLLERAASYLAQQQPVEQKPYLRLCPGCNKTKITPEAQYCGSASCQRKEKAQSTDNDWLDAELDKQFTWFVSPNDPGKWESYNKRKAIVKAAIRTHYQKEQRKAEMHRAIKELEGCFNKQRDPDEFLGDTIIDRIEQLKKELGEES